MDKINAQIQVQLQDIYRQVIDADQYLEQIRQQGGAKFTEVFATDSVFDTQSNRFQPYLQELTEHYDAWRQTPADETKLQAVIVRMQLMLSTLATLKQVRQAG